jgi:hypothetical protein
MRAPSSIQDQTDPARIPPRMRCGAEGSRAGPSSGRRCPGMCAVCCERGRVDLERAAGFAGGGLCVGGPRKDAPLPAGKCRCKACPALHEEDPRPRCPCAGGLLASVRCSKVCGPATLFCAQPAPGTRQAPAGRLVATPMIGDLAVLRGRDRAEGAGHCAPAERGGGAAAPAPCSPAALSSRRAATLARTRRN